MKKDDLMMKFHQKKKNFLINIYNDIIENYESLIVKMTINYDQLIDIKKH